MRNMFSQVRPCRFRCSRRVRRWPAYALSGTSGASTAWRSGRICSAAPCWFGMGAAAARRAGGGSTRTAIRVRRQTRSQCCSAPNCAAATAHGRPKRSNWGDCPVLLGASRHHPELIVRKRPVQQERLGPRCRHPRLEFFRLGQDRRHGLWVIGADDAVRLGGEEGEQVVGGLAFLDLPDRRPARPDAGEEGERPGLVEGEPDGRPRTVRQRLVLGKAGEGYPCGEGRLAVFGRRRHVFCP